MRNHLGVVLAIVLGVCVLKPAFADIDSGPCRGKLLPVETIVLDTNVLLNKPTAFLDYSGDKRVAIAYQTLKELESKKGDPEHGFAARQFFKEFEAATGEGSLSAPIELKNGSSLVILNLKPVMAGEAGLGALDLGAHGNPDDRILGAMIQYQNQYPGIKVVLVSEDRAFKIKARTFDFEARSFEGSTPATSSATSTATVAEQHQDANFTGYVEYELPAEKVQELHSAKNPESAVVRIDQPDLFYDNQFVILSGQSADPSMPRVMRYRAEDQSLHAVRYPFGFKESRIGQISPLDFKQGMAMDLLMDTNVKSISLMGGPGSGKTLLAMAAALEQKKNGIYEHIFYMKPYMNTADVGFLPGTLDEKTARFHRSFVQNLGVIFGKDKVKAVADKCGNNANEILRQFGMEPLDYGTILGESLHNAYIIVDEAENLTELQISSLTTRVGKDSKIVLAGDLGQTHLPGVRTPEMSPFFKYVNHEEMKRDVISGHVTLNEIEGYRGAVANLWQKVSLYLRGAVPKATPKVK
jgi:PhoH-like ATPase